MRRVLLAGLCFYFAGYGVLSAQNKTLGVGVTTPNQNAALHVESPTANQGFIMPRLTTAQRDAMIPLLTAADKGLMLYDTDQSAIFIWDGLAWESSSQFTITNPASVDDAIEALTTGSGSAGRFTINNTGSFSHAVYAESNGDSTSAAVHGNHLGEGFGVFGKSAGSKFASAAVYGEHVGTGDAAGAFRISNAASSYSALYGETNGSGPAVYGNQLGLGRGAQFQITNTANTESALRSYTAGTGNAGFYTISNAANDSSAIFSTTNGTGPAISGLSTGTGHAAAFRTSNTANASEALFVESFGTGRVASFVRRGTGGGATVFAHVLNSGHGLWAEHEGTNGYAAILQSVNAANPNPAIFVEALGSGPSIFTQKSQATSTGDGIFSEHLGTSGSTANLFIANAANPSPALISATMGAGPAILGENRGPANGFAGSFANTDPANTYPAIQASTAGSGPGVRVMQGTGNGAGMDIFMQNATSTAPGMAVDQQGLGHAASFVVNNTANSLPAVQALNNGTGTALEAATSTGFTAIHAKHDGPVNGNAALVEITNTANAYPALQANTAGTGNAINAEHTGASGDVIYAQHSGAAQGSAGNFRIANGSNIASALFGVTSAADGTGIGASNEANGIALALWSGGMQITTHVVTTQTIATRAAAYQVTGTGPFSFAFALKDGEVFMVFNDTATDIILEGVQIPAGQGKTLVVFPGRTIRGF